MGPRADVVNVLSRYLRFYSIFDQKSFDHEVDVADLAFLKYGKVFCFYLYLNIFPFLESVPFGKTSL